jgi:hypothetical protein
MVRELNLYGFASCDYVLNWGALGVEREIFSSSSLMSAGTSANRGVLKWRSPVSGSMQSMFAYFSASAATLSAPTGDGMLVDFVSAVDAAHHQLNRLGAVGTIAFRLFVERRNERVH